MQPKPLNDLSEKDCKNAFERCCGSSAWVEAMLARRPFASMKAVFDAAESIWWNLKPSDWLEAFTHHPKIGDLDSLRERFAATSTWASDEQGSVSRASEATLERLHKGNKDYEDKFGFIFIIFATGKSADEMLVNLLARLQNSREDEIRIAANEQIKITHLRLEKLCQEVQSPRMS